MTQLLDPVVLRSLVSGLRDRLDTAIIRIADLEAERDSLRTTLLGEAEVADAEREIPERKGSAWWMAAWREVSRHRTELLHTVQRLEGWLLDSGKEAARLQTELDRAREQNAGLARQLAETERDYTEMFADREELLGRLARAGEGAVH